jgi:hypothetical protein
MHLPRLLSFIMLLAIGPCAIAQLAKRDLKVELRQIEERRESAEGYSTGTASANASWQLQTLVVRNGEKATLRMQQSVPMQWVQSAQSQSSSLKLAGAEASAGGGGVTQALHWFDVGQSMTVTPKWPGGKKDVALAIEVQQSDMQAVHNADLPRQTRNQLITTVTVPLNTWVIIAASGRGSAPAGSYSSEGGNDARRLLQVRVTLAPDTAGAGL